MQKRSTIKCHYTSRLAQVKTAENPMSARLSDDLIMGVTGRVCWDGTYTCPCPTLSLQGIPNGSELLENVHGSTVHNSQNLETIQIFMCNRTGKIGVYSYSGLLFCVWMQKHRGASNTILREESGHKIIYCESFCIISYKVPSQAKLIHGDRIQDDVLYSWGWAVLWRGIWRATWEGLQDI